MLKKLSILIFSMTLLSFLLPEISKAQVEENFRMRLESILQRFKNYRYSTISIYRVTDIKDIRKAIKEKQAAEGMGGGTEVADAGKEALEGVERAVTSLVEREVQGGATQTQVQRELIMRGLPVPDNFAEIYAYYQSQIVTSRKQLRNAYIITTRKSKNDIVPNTIIAMIATYEDETSIKDNIDMPSPSLVYTRPELIDFDLSDEYAADNMYGLVVNAFQQGLVEDRTLEAQGIGTFATFAPKRYGVSKSLVENEAEIEDSDIQTFKRITEGQPNDIISKHNELVLGPDLISWKRYETPTIVYSDGFIDTLSNVTNSALPKIGFEIKYGLEEINYPSFWSERMTASAVWDNVKLGMILPTNGWAGISEDVFSLDRKFTYAGVGIASTIDFPIRVIPKSGVFRLSMGYVFGDAEKAPYKDNYFDNEDLQIGAYNRNFAESNKDFLIRYNGQFHYTFGMSIDEDYMLRFGLGGTVYGMESWFQDSTTVVEDGFQQSELSYNKYESEAVGGISASMDFMVRNISTPYGATIQYFDQSIYGNIWLQIPVVENTFAVRLDAKGYAKVFPDEVREWEQESLFIPTARFIVNF